MTLNEEPSIEQIETKIHENGTVDTVIGFINRGDEMLEEFREAILDNKRDKELPILLEGIAMCFFHARTLLGE